MTKVVASGKTVEIAVEQGLSQLGVSRDRVTVSVLEQPSKGFLGLFRTREAKVELTLLPLQGQEEMITASEQISASAPVASAPSIKEQHVEPVSVDPDDIPAMAEQQTGPDPYEEAVQFLIDVAREMGLTIKVNIHHGKDGSTFDIIGSELGMLIGRRGQTLDSLQYLVNIVANRYSTGFIRIILDAENFRARRQKTLEDLAERLAGQVLRTGKESILEPMPAAERKIIHARLQHHKQIKTYSKGEDPNRRVVISRK
ncbi:RNA-binding cell elongation regulator Jag/EloR [Paenibacillus sp. JX-17]|uniref:RNA-binding protein KhpB n=1 Tax=Paenibacillus lacisoli TaxID=3064525 RepID=A0ABT9CEN8_9BACL|nr:RNA-binding cell elongation regulator Jag/EloR [Paenibacillus sp. JX-17]MDO7906161.1 RNA-binding cell elongation regulator Jag/EloR [Paenibacillus sp. JX-17]